MQKFAAVVTYLRSGWHLVYAAAPVALAWYFVTPFCSLWFWTDHFYAIWEFKHRVMVDEVNQHIALGLLIALGFALVCGALVFMAWVFYTRKLDLEFTKSSVGALALGCFMFGMAGITQPYFNVNYVIPMACGTALLLLETHRMRVLASTY